MSKGMSAAQAALQQKIKVLSKLFDDGYASEKDLQTLELAQMLKIPNITVPELAIIVELQKSVKTHTLYSYLGGGVDERNEQRNDEQNY
jgi:hypothetical protein